MLYKIIQPVIILLMVSSFSFAYNIVKLTNGGTNVNPKVSNGYIAWEGNGIYLYDVAAGTSKVVGSGYLGGLYGNRVAWNSGSSWSADPWYYDGQNSIRLVTTASHDKPPIVTKDLVVWSGNGSYLQTDYEIFVYNGQNVSRITSNSSCDENPVAGDGIIAWHNRQTTGPGKIMMRDLRTGVTSTLGTSGNAWPQVNGTTIAWSGSDGNVMIREAGLTRSLTAGGSNSLIALTESCVLYSSYNVQTQKIQLMANDGQQNRLIFQYDNNNTIWGIKLCDDYLVWHERGQDDALYWCNINAPGRNLIAIGDYIMEFGISGNTVVWENRYGNGSDIYYTVIPEPATMVLLGLGGMMLRKSKRGNQK